MELIRFEPKVGPLLWIFVVSLLQYNLITFLHQFYNCVGKMGEMLTKLYRLVCHAVWQFSQHFIYFINTIINLVKKPSIKCFKLFFEGKLGRAIANCFGYPSFLGFVYFNFFFKLLFDLNLNFSVIQVMVPLFYGLLSNVHLSVCSHFCRFFHKFYIFLACRLATVCADFCLSVFLDM